MSISLCRFSCPCLAIGEKAKICERFCFQLPPSHPKPWTVPATGTAAREARRRKGPGCGVGRNGGTARSSYGIGSGSSASLISRAADDLTNFWNFLRWSGKATKNSSLSLSLSARVAWFLAACNRMKEFVPKGSLQSQALQLKVKQEHLCHCGPVPCMLSEM